MNIVTTHSNNVVTGALGAIAAMIWSQFTSGNVSISTAIISTIATIVGYIIHSNSVAATVVKEAAAVAPVAETFLPANMKVFADYLIAGLTQAINAPTPAAAPATTAPATATQ